MNLQSNLNKILAFVWLVIIGTNVAGYYAFVHEERYQGAVILAGAVYFLSLFHKELLRLVAFKDYLVVLFVTTLPLVLMALSRHPFERAAYTIQISIVLIFVVASVLASRRELTGAVMVATCAIIAIGTTLNLYELFIEHNAWSTAPGRSAGLYINPNISSTAILGYGLVILSSRVGKLKVSDLILVVVVLVGIFTTFSRGGILASLVLLGAAVLLRAHREDTWRILAVGMGVVFVFFMFGAYVFLYLDLSLDAALRIESLINSGGVGDYEGSRGTVAENALQLVEDPIFGVGVRTVSEMEEGPHNMYVAMLVDYGAIGLMIYLLFIARLVLVASRTDRTVSGLIWLYVGWLTVFGFVSHNLMDEPSTMPFMGFALAQGYKLRFQKNNR